MKTKAEIKQYIKKLTEMRDNAFMVNIEGRARYQQAINFMITGLKYALGYKLDTYYWCTKCSIAHRNVRCSKCGNDNLRETGSNSGL